MKIPLRLHFRTGLGDIKNGSNTEHRAELVKLIKVNFDVPNDVELRMVWSHWLNINMEPHIVDEVLDYLSSLPLYEGFGIFNAYPMDDVAENNSSIQNFLAKNNFEGN